jgi:ubiquinone/menaquinone biosynthesis C-methylase UbiE
MYNKNLFNLKGVWETYVSGEILDQKVSILKKYLPSDVSSIIDIGCGNGVITNQLAQEYRIVGIDSSEEALQYVTAEKICCSADAIPLPDKSFGLALSSELLEHLPDEIMENVLKEMIRLADKYLLITVPYSEVLLQQSLPCPSCKTIFHAYGHLHSFDMNYLSSRLPANGLQLIKWGTHGPSERRYNSLLLKVRQRFGNQYFPASEYTICPNCGNRQFPVSRTNLLTKFCNGMNRVIGKKRPVWLFALYQLHS